MSYWGGDANQQGYQAGYNAPYGQQHQQQGGWGQSQPYSQDPSGYGSMKGSGFPATNPAYPQGSAPMGQFAPSAPAPGYGSGGSSYPSGPTPTSGYQSSYQYNASAPPTPSGGYPDVGSRAPVRDQGTYDSGDYGSRYASGGQNQGFGKGYGKDSRRFHDQEDHSTGRPRFDREDGGRDFRDGGKGKGYSGKGWGKGYDNHKGGSWNYDGFKGGFKGYGKGKGSKGGFDRDRDEGRWESTRDVPQEEYGKRDVRREEKPEERKRTPTPPPRSRSVELKRSVKISSMPVTSLNRQYQDVKLRYKDLHVSGDFTKFVASWTGQVGFTHEAMLENSPKFNLGPELALPVQKNLPATLDASGTKHNAKVVLLTVDADSAQHLTLQLKFLVCKVEKGLICPGGAWNEVDGSDPYDDAVLRNTAIRTVKTMCGIDLSSCAQWVKFTEIWYHRPEEGAELPEMKERVVIFVPDCWNHPDLSFDVHYQLKGLAEKDEGDAKPVAKENDAEVPPPTAPEESRESKPEDSPSGTEQPTTGDALSAKKDAEVEGSTGPEGAAEQVTKDEIRKEAEERTRKRNIVCKPMVISLDGLLDYDVDDNYEKTAEVSLFAEAFHEMLQRDFGTRIFQFLKMKREQEKREKELRRAKRKAEDERQQEAKRRKQEEEAPREQDAQTGSKQLEENLGDGEPKGDGEIGGAAAEEGSSQKDNAEQCEGNGGDDRSKSTAEGEDAGADKEAIKAGAGECEVEQKEEQTEEQQLQAKEQLRARKAFQFFDKSDFGYLKAADVEKILYNLDVELSRRTVHGLVSSFRGERDRVEYLSLCRR